MKIKTGKCLGFSAVLAVLMLLLTACGKAKEPQTVTLRFDSNPSTGYSWQVSQSEELFDVESSYEENETDAPLSGAGGTETIVLTPKKAGTCEVTVSYMRPWETTEEPDQQLVYTFKIDRRMQVQMLSAIGYSTEYPIGTPSPEIA